MKRKVGAYVSNNKKLERRATDDDDAGELLRRTPVKHSGRVEASRVRQRVAKAVDLAGHHVVVVTLIHRRHRRAVDRPTANRQQPVLYAG